MQNVEWSYNDIATALSTVHEDKNSETVFYSGSWNSSQIPSVYGQSHVRLPKDLNKLQNFKTVLYIDYLGSYKSGARICVPVTIELFTIPSPPRCPMEVRPNSREEKNNFEKKYSASGVVNNSNEYGSIGFKMKGEQDLTFTTSYVGTDVISGKYESSSPNDRGVFILSPTNLTRLPARSLTANCIIF